MQIRDRIEAACAAHGRSPDEVTLIAVSKFQPWDTVTRLMHEGQRDFGENRAQEAIEKWSRKGGLDPDTTLHFLGRLQRNKVESVVRTCQVVHSLDSTRLASALSAAAARHGRTVPCFVQVNIGAEPQKPGVPVERLAELLAGCTDQPHLEIVGLMCVPPSDEPAEPYFERLRELAGRHGLEQLSMGMTADFETAIGCGATHVRIGRALFGDRPAQYPERSG